MNEEQAVTELFDDGRVAFGMAVMLMATHLTTEHGMTKAEACDRLGVTEEEANQVVESFKAVMDGES